MASAGYVTEVKLFGRWSFEDVEVKDISLADYIACKPKYAQFLPHSQGRWQKKRFRKAQCPIVERMVCSMMRYGRNNGARPKSRTPLRPQLPPVLSERGSTVPPAVWGRDRRRSLRRLLSHTVAAVSLPTPLTLALRNDSLPLLSQPLLLLRPAGKKLMAVRIVKHAFEIVHLLTDQNPVQVYVDAVINCGPREDSTRVGGGGAVRRQACDVSPLRRVNQSIYLITTGAREASFRNIKTIAECLADEIMNAAKGSSNSYAIKKKDEIERVAKSNR